jgi:hypothetical protein
MPKEKVGVSGLPTLHQATTTYANREVLGRMKMKEGSKEYNAKAFGVAYQHKITVVPCEECGHPIVKGHGPCEGCGIYPTPEIPYDARFLLECFVVATNQLLNGNGNPTNEIGQLQDLADKAEELLK